MAYVKTTLDKAVKRTRVRIPRFEKTEEWKALKRDLDRGLKPGTVLQIRFGPEEMKKYRITNRRTVARYLQKYITEHKLPYEVLSWSDTRIAEDDAGSRSYRSFFVQVRA